MRRDRQAGGTVLGYKGLKERQRAIRATFSELLGLRVHRTISWLGRAEKAGDDYDVRFILFWVAFNAAYAQDVRDAEASGERNSFRTFFDALVGLDVSRHLCEAVWERFLEQNQSSAQ